MAQPQHPEFPAQSPAPGEGAAKGNQTPLQEVKRVLLLMARTLYLPMGLLFSAHR